MGTLLTGGTLVEFEPAAVERGDLRIEDGRVAARGSGAVAAPGDEVIDVSGKLIIPGLVSAHHHLYSTLLRGTVREQPGFAAEWAALSRLEDALDHDAVQAAAAAGALEGLTSGTTTVFDLHASPRAIAGSLPRVARGLADVGLRAVLGYQVSDRHGAVSREEGLDETISFIARARGRIRGMIGASSCDVLPDDALDGIRAALASTRAQLHLHLGEDPHEEERSKQKYELTGFERLEAHGLVTERTLLAQAVHLAWPELSKVLSLGAWVVHSPRSNMVSQTGAAPAGKFGVKACVGTDTQPLDALAEAQLAWLKARDAGQPIDVLRYLANGHRVASQAFGETIGPLRPGALADLLVFDYRPPTPLTDANLAMHVLSGFSSRHVESVMVDGIWRLWAHKPLAVKAEEVAEAAREATHATCSRIAAQTAGPGPIRPKALSIEAPA